VSGQICVSEGETVAASVRNCAIESAINMTMKRMTASRRSVSTQGNSSKSSEALGGRTGGGAQRPPHLPGQDRRQLTGSMTPAELAVSSAAVRRVRTALHRWRRSTGGGRSQRTTPYQPPAICAIALWRETLFLAPLCPAQKKLKPSTCPHTAWHT
jgi:hypothetical protein